MSATTPHLMYLHDTNPDVGRMGRDQCGVGSNVTLALYHCEKAVIHLREVRQFR